MEKYYLGRRPLASLVIQGKSQILKNINYSILNRIYIENRSSCLPAIYLALPQSPIPNPLWVA